MREYKDGWPLLFTRSGDLTQNENSWRPHISTWNHLQLVRILELIMFSICSQSSSQMSKTVHWDSKSSWNPNTRTAHQNSWKSSGVDHSYRGRKGMVFRYRCWSTLKVWTFYSLHISQPMKQRREFRLLVDWLSRHCCSK